MLGVKTEELVWEPVVGSSNDLKYWTTPVLIGSTTHMAKLSSDSNLLSIVSDLEEGTVVLSFPVPPIGYSMFEEASELLSHLVSVDSVPTKAMEDAPPADPPPVDPPSEDTEEVTSTGKDKKA